MREIPDAQAEMEWLAGERRVPVIDPAVREYLTRRYAFTKQQIDSLRPENVALLLAADGSRESE